MRRNLLWTAAVAAVALWVGAAEGGRAWAQEAADSVAETATGQTDASADTSGVAEATADNTAASTAATGQADAQADAQAGAQPATTTDATADAAADAAADAQPPTTAPAQTDGTAQADAAAQPLPAQPAQPAQPGARTDIDASLQGRAGLDAAGATAQQDLSAGLQFGQPTDRGLAINAIDRSSLFFNSGLRQNDVLVSFDGRPIRTQADFARWAVFQPGRRIPVVVLREGRPQTIFVTFQQRPGFIQHQAGYAPAGSGAWLGVTFDQAAQGAVVVTVAPGSPAQQVGVQPGDVIVAISGRQVAGPHDVIRTVASLQPGQQVDIAISRRVVLGTRPGVAQATYQPGVRVEPAPVVAAPPPTTVIQEPAPVVPVVPRAAVDDNVDVFRPRADLETPRERRIERRRGVEID